MVGSEGAVYHKLWPQTRRCPMADGKQELLLERIMRMSEQAGVAPDYLVSRALDELAKDKSYKKLVASRGRLRKLVGGCRRLRPDKDA